MSKKSILDSIDVPVPCPKDWNKMKGDEKSRFCESCEKDIYNLSQMTREEAQKILFESKEKVCVRLEREADGTIKYLKKQLHQITRQTSIAAGVLSASLSLSTMLHAQEEIVVGTTASIISAENQDRNASISFMVSNINDGRIPNATVILTNLKTQAEIVSSSDATGSAKFNALTHGKYKAKIFAPNFASKEFIVEIKQPNMPDMKVNLIAGTVGEFVFIKPSRVERNDENESATRKTSQISFTIYDSQEAIINNADVELINQKTKQEFNAQTNEKGIAQFNNLPHGRYEVKVSADGFQIYQQGFEIKEPIEPNLEITLSVSSMVGVVYVAEYEIPLFQAISQDDTETVKKIIASGFDVNTKNSDKDTALHIAVENKNVEIVKTLLDAGAKVNVKNKSKRTPFSLLKDDSEDKDKSTLKILRLLIAKGADVNYQNEDKETFLMLACEYKSIEIVNILLAAGANPNLKDNDGETALSKTDSPEIKNLLLKFGAKNSKK